MPYHNNKTHRLQFRALLDADTGGEESFLRARVCELDTTDRIEPRPKMEVGDGADVRESSGPVLVDMSSPQKSADAVKHKRRESDNLLDYVDQVLDRFCRFVVSIFPRHFQIGESGKVVAQGFIHLQVQSYSQTPTTHSLLPQRSLNE